MFPAEAEDEVIGDTRESCEFRRSVDAEDGDEP